MTTPSLSADTGADAAVVLPFPRADQPPQTDQIPADAEPPEPADEEGDLEESARLVDGPDLPAPKPWHQPPGVRHPLPGWMSSKAELKLAAAWAARHTAYVCRYHALHALYDYAPKLAGRSPRGVWRVLSATWRWAVDREGHPMRAEAVARNDAETYLKLSRQRNERVAARGIMLCFAAVASTVAAVAGYAAASTLQVWGLGALLVGGCGMLGAPADKPLISAGRRAHAGAEAHLGVVVRALGSLGHRRDQQALAKGGDGITFPAPITRDGPGWRAEVDLPYGVTVPDVIERRDKLASGLRRPLGCVWPEPRAGRARGAAGALGRGPGHERRQARRRGRWPRPVRWTCSSRCRSAPTSAAAPSRHADVRQRADRRRCPAGQDVRRCGCCCSPPRWTRSRAARLRAEGHRRPRPAGEGRPPTTAPAPMTRTSPRPGRPARAAQGAGAAARKTIQRPAPAHGAGVQGHPGAGRGRKSLGLHPLVLAIDECQELFDAPRVRRGSRRAVHRPSSSAVRRWA